MPPRRKNEDFALLARFLEREAERFQALAAAREALHRIGSLAEAEAEARKALEEVQADLAWTKLQAAKIEASLPQARDAARKEITALRREIDAALRNEHLRRQEEESRLEAAIAEKRALLAKLTGQIEAVRTRLAAMPQRPVNA